MVKRIADGGYVQPHMSQAEFINEQVGKVYLCSAKAFAGTLATALVCAKTSLAARMLATYTSATLPGILALTAVGIALVAFIHFTPREDSAQKYGLFGLFSVWNGLVISPLVLFNTSMFIAAASTTVVITGGLGIAAMRLKHSFERYETIMQVALSAICLASLGALAFAPAAAAFAHEISFIGGLALFSCYVITDTQEAREKALEPDFDEIKHSLHLYLNALNLFIRIWEIYARGQQEKK